LRETGHAYSSSVYPIKHDHYGMPDAPRFAYRPDGGSSLPELPLTTLNFMGHNMPFAGGGYFRLLPYAVSRWGIRRVNRREGQSSIFYFHPWEIDPDQPRFPSTPPRTRFRHYVNLRRMSARLRALLRDFEWDRIDRVFDIAPGQPAASSTAHAAE
jgi:polysaccharide deacetylase family protein (PEP-CTERM system associated)